MLQMRAYEDYDRTRLRRQPHRYFTGTRSAMPHMDFDDYDADLDDTVIIETQVPPSIIFESLRSSDPTRARSTTTATPETFISNASITMMVTVDDGSAILFDEYPIPCAPSLTINHSCNPYGGDCHILGRVIPSCESYRKLAEKGVV